MKDLREHATADVVRQIEELLGFPADVGVSACPLDVRMRYRARFIEGVLELSYGVAGGSVWLLISPRLTALSPKLKEWLKHHYPHGLCDGFSKGMQAYRVAPRNVPGLVGALDGGAVHKPFSEVGDMDYIPGEFIDEAELYHGADWNISKLTHHPALIDPAPCVVVSFATNCPEFVFTATEVYVVTPWPVTPWPMNSATMSRKLGNSFSWVGNGWHGPDDYKHPQRPTGVHIKRWDYDVGQLVKFLGCLPIPEATHAAPGMLQ